MLLCALVGWSSCTDKNAVISDVSTGDRIAADTMQTKFSDSVNVQLFYLYELELNDGTKSGFVSLSDIYHLSEHRDSLAMPAVSSLKDKQYTVLAKKYRDRFLTKTKISEEDSLFVFDYSAGVTRSFLIKDLNVAANQNIYSVGDEQLSQYNYEFGFEIPKDQLGNIGFNDNFVAVGKENPFSGTPLLPLAWKKISNLAFPEGISKNLNQFTSSVLNSTLMASNEHYRFFIRDYQSPEDADYIVKRHLIVTDLRGKELIQEKIFAEDEGRSIVPINSGAADAAEMNAPKQWSGNLLKDQPEVVFGFEYVSFGCPAIVFLDSSRKDLMINCDNRH